MLNCLFRCQWGTERALIYPLSSFIQAINSIEYDTVLLFQNKINMVSFLYSGGSGEMYHMQDIEVDPKAAAWLCYTLPSKLLSALGRLLIHVICRNKLQCVRRL